MHSTIEPLESRIAPAIFIVNTLGDPSATTAGQLSLRQAIAAANIRAFSHPGSNTILFKPGLTGVIYLQNSDALGIISDLIIDGPGAGKLTIDAAYESRIFYVGDSASVTLNGLSMVNGEIVGASGGAVYSLGPLTIENCVISGSYAKNASGVFDDAGTAGAFVLKNSTVSGNNTGTALAGGVYAHAETVQIINSKISGNYSGNDAGGLSVTGQNIVITNSLISGNVSKDGPGGAEIRVYGSLHHAKALLSGDQFVGNNSKSGPGGGGLNLYTPLPIPATITGSVFASNLANQGGAGLYIDGPGSLTISASRFSGNVAGQIGGGIYVSTYAGNVTIARSSILDNQAGVTGGGIGGNRTLGSGPGNIILDISATTIAENNAADGAGIGISTRISTKITGSLITDNFATQHGGGADIEGGNLTVASSKFIGNTAGSYGGGIELDSAFGNLTLSGNTIADNVGVNDGGGIYISNQCNFTISGGSITGNITNGEGGGIFIGGDAAGAIKSPGLLITGNVASQPGGGVAHPSSASGIVSVSALAVIGNTGGANNGLDYPNIFGSFT
jgi:hypothetical protein